MHAVSKTTNNDDFVASDTPAWKSTDVKLTVPEQPRVSRSATSSPIPPKEKHWQWNNNNIPNNINFGNIINLIFSIIIHQPPDGSNVENLIYLLSQTISHYNIMFRVTDTLSESI